MKYKIGDKIRVLRNITTDKGKNWLIGKAYEIKNVYEAITPYGQKYSIGETYAVFENEIELANTPSKILITTDGTKTLARLYEGKKVVKSAEAKHNPDDVSTFPFDFLEGAGWAFEDLTGLTVEHRNKTKVKPVERPEAVKLYCVKDCEHVFTKGKVYSFSTDKPMESDSNGFKLTHDSLDSFFHTHPCLKENLVPLVSRPAKVGEWVYVAEIEDEDGGSYGPYKIGDIFEVVDGAWGNGTLVKSDRTFRNEMKYLEKGEHVTQLLSHEYLVLDGYQPEPEKPKYYSGKVVCVENEYKPSGTISGFTVGKIYEVKDGTITNNDGWKSFAYMDIESLCRGLGNKFIEYKE